MQFKIPFNEPILKAQEQKYITEPIASEPASGNGSFSKRWHNLLEDSVVALKHSLPCCALMLWKFDATTEDISERLVRANIVLFVVTNYTANMINLVKNFKTSAPKARC